MNRCALALASILTFGCVAHGQVQPIIIENDAGGIVEQFAMWYARLALSGVPVRVRGSCDSACTMVLSLPPGQACIETTGSLGFHLFARHGEPSLEITLSFYSQAMQDWLVLQNLTLAMTVVPAADVVRLDMMAACAVDPPPAPPPP